jgi:hypothetical protein
MRAVVIGPCNEPSTSAPPTFALFALFHVLSFQFSVASVTEDKPGFLEVDEYRAAHLGLSDFPDQISSSGFAALALVFHPDMRDNFEMKCEGLSDWKGQSVC